MSDIAYVLLFYKPFRLSLSIVMVCFFALYGRAQTGHEQSQKWVDSILYILETDKKMDANLKSDLADSAFQISLRTKDLCRQLNARILQAGSLDFLGLADSALTQLYWAQNSFRPRCDSLILFDIYANITNSLLSLGELERVDSVSRHALAIWNPSWKKPEYRFTILNNLAISNVYNGDTLRGLQTFRQLLNEAVASADKKYARKALINLGTMKGMENDLDSAYYFFIQASDEELQQEDIIGYLDLQYNIAQIDIERKQYKEAGVRLDSLYHLAERRGSLAMMAAAQDARATLFANTLNFRRAYDYLRDYIRINEMVLNEERIKAVTEMMEKYESEKKARQIERLKVENLDAALRTERLENARNRYLYIGAGVFLIAIGLYSRLHYTYKAKAAIQREKDISEGLLLNILPSSVADELKAKGHADAKLFDEATILFSDFKNFTEIAGTMGPSELVEELNTCFKAFDEIMEKYGLEKIKTIGDAYMAAAAIPETSTSKALHAIRATLEMQRFIENRKTERENAGLYSFEMRVGVHSGPVVAGIVGVKKFQYDLWGDTVNIASRMETNGEPGRVNISEITYQLVKDEPSLTFIHRGMVHVKGKGELAMYFVEQINT